MSKRTAADHTTRLWAMEAEEAARPPSAFPRQQPSTATPHSKICGGREGGTHAIAPYPHV